MSRSVLLLASLSIAALAPSARAEDGVVRWATVIGLIQTENLVGSGAGQVKGGGQPWSVRRGHASANFATGHVEFEVQGLVFAGGNGIGTPGGIVEVKGTLVCDTDGSAGGGNSVLVETPLVTLDPEGNARFEGDLGTLPAVCAMEQDIAFLVRIPAGRWIANGAVLRR